MFISKNYPQNLNESVTIARHYGNGALEFQFKQDAQQLMHRHFQQCAQLIYLHQIGSLTVRGEIFFENNWLTIW